MIIINKKQINSQKNNLEDKDIKNTELEKELKDLSDKQNNDILSDTVREEYH